jgi:nitroreductase
VSKYFHIVQQVVLKIWAKASVPQLINKNFREMDENLLGSFIRYTAHKLDKMTKTKWRTLSVTADYNRDRLIDALRIWRERTFDVSDDILWAERVLERYNKWSKGERPIIASKQEKKEDDVYNAIRQRRSVRLFKNKDVEEEKLTKVLEAGRWAPCSGNRQSWKFIVQKISRETPTMKQDLSFKKGSALIYVAIDERLYGEKEKFAAAMDAAAAIQNMLLMVHHIGLGGCWMYLADLVNQDKLRKILDLEDYYYVYSAILLGYPMEIPDDPGRKPLKKIVKMTGF